MEEGELRLPGAEVVRKEDLELASFVDPDIPLALYGMWHRVVA